VPHHFCDPSGFSRVAFQEFKTGGSIKKQIAYDNLGAGRAAYF